MTGRAAYHRPVLLTVDVGNTHLSLGVVVDGALVAARRAATRTQATPDEVEALVVDLLALDGWSLTDVAGLALASVVPTLTAACETVARRRQLPIVVASAGTVPLPIRVDRPQEVGADRLVNALAACRLHGTPAVVVDFGTATTFDCVAADGAYVGGAIAPGLEVALEALAARTAKLPRIELRLPDRAIGRDTVAAMQAGAIFGYRALTAGLLERVRAELADLSRCSPPEVRVIFTGGLSAAPWVEGIAGEAVVDPDLTLKGLAILYAEVTGTLRPAFAGGGGR